MLASIACGADLSIKGAFAKTARHQNAGSVGKNLVHIRGIKAFPVNKLDIDMAIIEDARMVQSLDNGKIGIGKLGIFAHYGNLDAIRMLVSMVLLANESIPVGHIALARVEAQALADTQVEVLVRQKARNIVDARTVFIGKHAIGVDIAEARDFGANAVVDIVIGAQDDDVGLDAKAAQLLNGMLRGLGLDLVSCGDIGNQAHVDEADVLGASIFAILADGLHKGLRLDVADGSTQLGDDHVGARLFLDAAELILDGVCDMGNHLDGAAQKIAAALARDQALVDSASGEVGIAGKVLVDKALIVTKVEVGLIAVLRNKDLAMLERTHGARVDVEIRVGFLHRHLISARLKKTAQRSRRDALAKRRNNATSYKNMLGHI